MIGTIDVQVRPLRLAFLIDPECSRQIRQAIQLGSVLWGGSYCPILPLYKRLPRTWRAQTLEAPSAENVLQGYIDAFDPDVFVQLSREVSGGVLSRNVTIIEPKDICEYLNAEGQPAYGIGIFELLNEIFDQHFRFKAKYPVEIIIPKIPKRSPLFWASWFGELPRTVLSQVQRHFTEPLEIQHIPCAFDRLPQFTSKRTMFPRRVTEYGIEVIPSSGHRNDRYIFYLDADQPADIVDFWNLRALGNRVLPVPRQFQNDPSIRLIAKNFLQASRWPWKQNPEIWNFATILCSRHCTVEEVQQFALGLGVERLPKESGTSPLYSIQHWYPRVWDEWAREKDGAIPCVLRGDAKSSIEITDTADDRVRFESLLPTFAASLNHSSTPRCANTISFRFYGSKEYVAEVLPQSSGSNYVRALSGVTGFGEEWRIGRSGLVKLVRYAFNETLEIPLAERIANAWFKDLGWEVELSPPGLLAKQISRTLDGNLSVLANEQILGLLEHMNGGTPAQDGNPFSKSKIDQDRDLAIGEVKSRLSSASRGWLNEHDYLIRKGVFKTGLRLQCTHCLRNAWYGLESIRDTFSCPRCLNTFPAIGNIDKSIWSYKTAGPFSVARYADGAHSVLLTTQFLSDRRMHGMRLTPLLSFIGKKAGKPDIEADLAAFWQSTVFGETQEGILFAECKSYNSFQKRDFERMRSLAEEFEGCVLVFSSLRKSLTPEEVTSLRAIAKRGRRYWKPERPRNPVLVLTGKELFADIGAPNCWSEPLCTQFNRVAGLLSLCNATQQIYLGLEPWESDWRKQWQKAHRRPGK